MAAITSAALADVVVPRAGATYPGSNGRLVFSRFEDDGWTHLYTVRPDGTGLRQVTFGNSSRDHPAYAPEGRRLAFSDENRGLVSIMRLSTPDSPDPVAVALDRPGRRTIDGLRFSASRTANAIGP